MFELNSVLGSFIFEGYFVLSTGGNRDIMSIGNLLNPSPQTNPDPGGPGNPGGNTEIYHSSSRNRDNSTDQEQNPPDTSSVSNWASNAERECNRILSERSINVPAEQLAQPFFNAVTLGDLNVEKNSQLGQKIIVWANHYKENNDIKPNTPMFKLLRGITAEVTDSGRFKTFTIFSKSDRPQSISSIALDAMKSNNYT